MEKSKTNIQSNPSSLYGAALSSLAFIGAAHSASAIQVDLNLVPGAGFQGTFSTSFQSSSGIISGPGGYPIIGPGGFFRSNNINQSVGSFLLDTSGGATFGFNNFGVQSSFFSATKSASGAFNSNSSFNGSRNIALNSGNGLSFSAGATGEQRFNFTTSSGQDGWILIDLGSGISDGMTFLEGKVEVADTPESGTTATSLLSGLAVLAAGSYVRSRSKKAS